MDLTLGQRRFRICPLSANDAAAYRTFFNELDAPTIRCRFGHMIAALSLDEARRMADHDPDRAPALAVFDQDSQAIVAIGRMTTAPDHQSAEIAVVVSVAFRRLGLGRIVLEQLIALARSKQLLELQAFIATDNAPVHRLLLSLGFHIIEPAANDEDADTAFALKL